MAAQGEDKGTIFCDKCFCTAPKTSEFCPNCGAPLIRNLGMDAADPATYPKLAQANLLRMRKEYKGAEDICLSILRQYPHHLAANTLLGDISAEKGDVAQAAEWYELALDIDPQSASLQEKLEAVRTVRKEAEVATTAEQLGLPVQKPKTAVWASVGIVLILGLAIVAYQLSQTPPKANATPQEQVDKPVILKGSDKAVSSPTGGTGTIDHPRSISPEDLELTQLLAQKAADGAFLVDARYELTTNGISVTYNVPSDKDERGVGASLATESFALLKDNLKKTITQVDLRALREGKLFYSAIVKKTDYEATLTDEWQNTHKGDAKAFLAGVLTQEKYAQENKPSDGGPDPSSPDKGTGNPPSASSTTTGTATPVTGASNPADKPEAAGASTK